ncbi:polyprotein [Plum bark necrosis stem pitting-associated virus]|uniref:Polyprotein n=1 Tax=Plum bark necrosis stem pitting-associated virus TaxID=675077 RepID=A8RS49_9CLOS|nr:polyprotein [Plum bark necrosis stem pitting-associated virus]ABW81234.1 polyprotein [Plum bark necrosis stem pitting-associated virus]
MKKSRPALGNKTYVEKLSLGKKEIARAASHPSVSLSFSTLAARYSPIPVPTTSKAVNKNSLKPSGSHPVGSSSTIKNAVGQARGTTVPKTISKKAPSTSVHSARPFAQGAPAKLLTRSGQRPLLPTPNSGRLPAVSPTAGVIRSTTVPHPVTGLPLPKTPCVVTNHNKKIFIPRREVLDLNEAVAKLKLAPSSPFSKSIFRKKWSDLGSDESLGSVPLFHPTGSPVVSEVESSSSDIVATVTTVNPVDKSSTVSTYAEKVKSQGVVLKEARHTCACGLPIVVRQLDNMSLPRMAFRDRLKNRKATFFSRDFSNYKYVGGNHRSYGWNSRLDGLLLDMGFQPEDFDHCLCQSYDDGGSIPAHADNEACYDKDVEVLTLNAVGSAKFSLVCKEGQVRFGLGPKEYFLMPAGCQCTHKHAVQATSSGRISLTFRNSKNLKTTVSPTVPAVTSSSMISSHSSVSPRVARSPSKRTSPSGITYFKDGRDVACTLNETASVLLPLSAERKMNMDTDSRPKFSIPLLQGFVDDGVRRNSIGSFGKKFFVLNDSRMICVVDKTTQYMCSIPQGIWFWGLRAGKNNYCWMKRVDDKLVFLAEKLQYPTLHDILNKEPTGRLVGHGNVSFYDDFYRGTTLGRRGYCWVNPILDSGLTISELPNLSHVPKSFVLAHIKDAKFVVRGKYLHFDKTGKTSVGTASTPVGAAEVEPSFDLSKIDSLGSDQVLNRVLDTIASRPVFKEGSSVMVTLDNILSNYINNSLKLKQSTHIVLNQFLTDEERDMLANIFGGVHMEFKQQWRGSHSFLNSMRAILNHLIHMEYHCFKISSIGGNFGGHLLYGPSDVHICCPLLETRDGQRFWKTFHDSFSATHQMKKGDVVDAKKFMRVLTNSMCYKPCGECDVPSTVLTLVDVYDIPLHTLLRAMEKKGAVIAKVAFMFCPELALSNGTCSYPGAGVTVCREGDLLTYFVGDSGESYVHSFEVLSSYVSSERAMSEQKLLYSVELSGCYGPYVLFTVSITSDVMSKPTTSRVFPAWRRNKTLIKYVKYDGVRHHLNSIYVDRDFATRMLLYMSNVAASFEDKTLEYAISALRSHKTTMVVGSRLIHSKVELPNDAVVEIAASFTKEAVKRRHLNRKSLTSGSVWALVIDFLTSPIKWLKSKIRALVESTKFLSEWLHIRDLSKGLHSYVEDVPDTISLELQSCSDEFYKLNVAAVCEVMNFSRAALIQKLDQEITEVDPDDVQASSGATKLPQRKPGLYGAGDSTWYDFLLQKGKDEDVDSFYKRLWRLLRKISLLLKNIFSSTPVTSCYSWLKTVVSSVLSLLTSAWTLLSLKKKVTAEVAKAPSARGFKILGGVFGQLGNNLSAFFSGMKTGFCNNSFSKLLTCMVSHHFSNFIERFSFFSKKMSAMKNDFACMAKSYGVSDFDNWIVKKPKEDILGDVKKIFTHVLSSKLTYIPPALLLAIPVINFSLKNKDALKKFGDRVMVAGCKTLDIAFKAKYIISGFLINTCCNIPLAGLVGFLHKNAVLEGMVLSKLARAAVTSKYSLSLLVQILAVLPLQNIVDVYSSCAENGAPTTKSVDLHVNVASLDGDKAYLAMIKNLRDGFERTGVKKSAENLETSLLKEELSVEKDIKNPGVPDFVPDLTPRPVDSPPVEKEAPVKSKEGEVKFKHVGFAKEPEKVEAQKEVSAIPKTSTPPKQSPKPYDQVLPRINRSDALWSDVAAKGILDFVGQGSRDSREFINQGIPVIPVEEIDIPERADIGLGLQLQTHNVEVAAPSSSLNTSPKFEEPNLNVVQTDDVAAPVFPVKLDSGPVVENNVLSEEEEDVIEEFLKRSDERYVGHSDDDEESVISSLVSEASSFSSSDVFYADTQIVPVRKPKDILPEMLRCSGLSCLLSNNLLEDLRVCVKFTRKVDLPTDKVEILEWLAYEARDLWCVLDTVRNIEVGGFVGKGARSKSFTIKNLSTNIMVTCYTNLSELDRLLDQDDKLRQKKLVYCFGSSRMKDNLTSVLPGDFPCFDLASDTPCYGYMKLLAVQKYLHEILVRKHSFPIEYINAVPGAGKTYAILRKIENTTEPLLVLSSTKANKIEIASKVPKHLLKIIRVRTVDSALINFDNSPIYTNCEMLIDECYLPHAGQLQAIFSLYTPSKVSMYGDRHQIPFIPRTEGFVCTRAEHNIDEDKYSEVLKSYRCPADICYWMNCVAKAPEKVYSGLVTTFNKVLRSVVKIPSAVIPSHLIKEANAILTFTQADKEMAFKFVAGAKLGMKQKIHVSTIHEAQGKTFENVIIYRGRQAEDDVYRSLPHRLVGLTRHTKSLKYVVHPARTADTLSKDIDNILKAKDYVLSSFLIEQCS